MMNSNEDLAVDDERAENESVKVIVAHPAVDCQVVVHRSPEVVPCPLYRVIELLV